MIPGFFVMKKFSILLLLMAIVIVSNLYAYQMNSNPVQRANKRIDGEKLFKSMCIGCHKCDKEYTGPMLKGTKSRWKNKKAMYKFVRFPQEVIEIDKEPYAIELYQKYNVRHLSYPSLTDKKIDAILNYCGN